MSDTCQQDLDASVVRGDASGEQTSAACTGVPIEVRRLQKMFQTAQKCARQRRRHLTLLDSILTSATATVSCNIHADFGGPQSGSTHSQPPYRSVPDSHGNVHRSCNTALTTRYAEEDRPTHGDRLRPPHTCGSSRLSGILEKPLPTLPTFSHSTDMCTTVATCKFYDLTTSPTALATVPRARGSFNFADRYQITSHTDGGAYRRRGDVCGCYASTSSTAWPKVVAPSADSLVIVPCTCTSSRLAGALAKTFGTIRCVYRVRSHVRDSNNRHFHPLDLIAHWPKRESASGIATFARPSPLPQAKSINI